MPKFLSGKYDFIHRQAEYTGPWTAKFHNQSIAYATGCVYTVEKRKSFILHIFYWSVLYYQLLYIYPDKAVGLLADYVVSHCLELGHR